MFLLFLPLIVVSTSLTFFCWRSATLRAMVEDRYLLTKMVDFLYSQDQINKVEIWYRRTLEINPREPCTLNNLALLLTETYQVNKKLLKESMELAQKALEGKKAAFNLDTLAQVYFKNGLFDESADA